MIKISATLRTDFGETRGYVELYPPRIAVPGYDPHMRSWFMLPLSVAAVVVSLPRGWHWRAVARKEESTAVIHHVEVDAIEYTLFMVANTEQ